MANLEGAQPPPPKLSKHSPSHTVAYVWNVSTRGILWRMESTEIRSPRNSLWDSQDAP